MIHFEKFGGRQRDELEKIGSEVYSVSTKSWALVHTLSYILNEEEGPKMSDSRLHIFRAYIGTQVFFQEFFFHTNFPSFLAASL